jgi:ABC-type bacteriocin/lantibiotic exporter with double-glycine peptidase domain
VSFDYLIYLALSIATHHNVVDTRIAFCAPNQYDIAKKSRPILMCGPNTLYMLLRTYDRPVTPSEFLREVNGYDQELSLAEMRDICVRNGLLVEARRCTYEDLVTHCQMPLILLLNPVDMSASSETGHYVLVFHSDPDGITCIDGTSGEERRYSRDYLCRNWKGYVLTQLNWATRRSGDVRRVMV